MEDTSHMSSQLAKVNVAHPVGLHLRKNSRKLVPNFPWTLIHAPFCLLIVLCSSRA